MVKVKFELHQYADVSTGYLTEKDRELLEYGAPHCIANVMLDGLPGEEPDIVGAIFYTPEFSDTREDTEEFDSFAEKAHQYGFSNHFIEVIRAAWEQKIPYVRFDRDGGQIDGMEEAPTPDQAYPFAGKKFRVLAGGSEHPPGSTMSINKDGEVVWDSAPEEGKA